MKKITNILYILLACAVGIVSRFLNDYILLFSVVAGVYLITLIPVAVRAKKITKFISETILIYLMVWLLVYILSSNII